MTARHAADPEAALQTYRSRRHFDQTPEPAGGGRPDAQRLSFVVQKHQARRLHYDFRLELDGVMKSWAIPKGPSTDPQVKRVAAPTEDHPIAYNSFEGTIPAGQYGAGTVELWDRGTWWPLGDPRQGLADGHLTFELRGQRLQGRWTLVRMRGKGRAGEEPWLLIKARDAGSAAAQDSALPPAPAVDGPPPGARAAALPAALAPQLATLALAPPTEAGAWAFEIKFDGYRLLTRAEGGRLQLFTRHGHDWTARLPALHEALQTMELPDGWYDGEIVMPGPAGRPSDFQALQNAFDTARTAGIVYWLFDLPYCAGQDLRGCTLDDRRAVLRRIVERKPHAQVRLSGTFEAAPSDVLQAACRLGLEGVIAKRRQSAYASRRSEDWRKLKCTQRQEFVVAGWTDPRGTRSGLGSLVLAVHGPDGALRHAGQVGTGFDRDTLARLRAQLDALAQDRPTLAGATGLPRGVHWVRPQLVAEVSFGEWTREGRVRHAVFHSLRHDKPARDITREQALPEHGADGPASGWRLTHPDRVIDSVSGATKQDLATYLAEVAPLMMEHLEGRPVALVRAPSGIAGPLFFQKHLEPPRPEGIVPLPERVLPGHPPLLVVAQPVGLLTAAQLNVVEFHTWNGRADDPERPDRLVFDLDPGEGVAWPAVQEAARLLRVFLEALGLCGWLKTSGGKGLHVVVPLQPAFDWPAVKGFARAVVQHLAHTLPDRFVARSGPRNRVGRIFVDDLRNGQGATTVCAWSVRARPGLGVSVPVRWDELPHLQGGAHWTLTAIRPRLALGNAPWADYAASACRLDAAMERLGFRPPDA